MPEKQFDSFHFYSERRAEPGRSETTLARGRSNIRNERFLEQRSCGKNPLDWIVYAIKQHCIIYFCKTDLF